MISNLDGTAACEILTLKNNNGIYESVTNYIDDLIVQMHVCSKTIGNKSAGGVFSAPSGGSSIIRSKKTNLSMPSSSASTQQKDLKIEKEENQSRDDCTVDALVLEVQKQKEEHHRVLQQLENSSKVY